MRLFVNALSLSNGYGIGRYTRTLLYGLSRIDRGGWTVYAYSRRAHIKDFEDSDGITLVNALMPEINRLLLEQFDIPAAVSRLKPRAYFAPDFTLPQVINVRRKIVTIHDMLVYTHPESISPKARMLYRTFMPRAITQADVVLADSDATAASIVDMYPSQSAKIRVVYPALSPAYADCGDNANAEENTGKMPIAFEKFKIDSPFILYVGGASSRKNLNMLLHCFADLRTNGELGCSLVLVGGDGTRTSAAGGIFDVGYQNDATVRWCYENALGLALISSGEGFGYPVLEALACGCPALISSNSAMSEISPEGKGVVECDPSDAASVMDALGRLEKDNGWLRAEIDKTEIRERFGAERFARSILDACDGG